MKKTGTSAGIFFRTFRSCMSTAWKVADSEYHIPKSRFQENQSRQSGVGTSPGGRGERLNRKFFRKFRHCITSAWEAADKHYHIPKSRHGKVF